MQHFIHKNTARVRFSFTHLVQRGIIWDVLLQQIMKTDGFPLYGSALLTDWIPLRIALFVFQKLWIWNCAKQSLANLGEEVEKTTK